jgi:hypothetical protein
VPGAGKKRGGEGEACLAPTCFDFRHDRPPRDSSRG